MKAIVVSLSVGASLLVSMAVGAQESTDDGLALEEIVVTARRAEETLQKVPLSITALGSKDIQAMGIARVEDVASLTPGFSFRNGFGRAIERPVIRGMANISGAANAAFFIDGVFVNGPITGYNLDNLERIEVIRGPQAALFGRSTFAGAINYVTRRPTDYYEASAKVSMGEFNYQDMSAWASGPLVEGKLRFQVGGRYFNKDGQYTNVASSAKDIGGTRSKSFSGALEWTPSDWFDAALRVNYTIDDDEMPPLFRFGDPSIGMTSNEIRNCYQPLTGTRRRGYYCGEVPSSDHLSASSTSFTAAGLDPGRQVNLFRSSLVMNAMWHDYTFVSTSSLDRVSNFEAFDLDYSSARALGGAFEIINFSAADYWSQELRVASPRDGRLRWQAGLYTYEENPDTTKLAGNLVANPTAGQPDLPPVITPQAVDSSTKNEAAFGMIEFDILENLTLTAEGRYAKDTIRNAGRSVFSKSSNTGFVPGSFSSGCTVTNTPVAGSPDRQTLSCANAYVNETSFSSRLPRFTATWLASESATYYAQYAKGNKPGGFNADTQNARTQPAARATLAALGLQAFEEEEADSFEIGFKSQLLDRRVQLNAALYLIDWTSQQLTQSGPVPEEGVPVGAALPPQFATTYNVNLGTSEIRGLEMEMRAALGRHWQLRMTYAHQDAKIKNYFSSDQADLVFAGPYTACIEGSQCYRDYLAAGNVSGNVLPRVPKHLASASLAASYPLGEWGEFSWRTDYSYEASRYAQVHNLAETGASHTVNMRLGIERDAWSATLWVNNLTDDDTAVDIQRYIDPTLYFLVPVQPPLPGTSGLTSARDFTIALPDRRMFGVTLAYRFR